MTAVARFIKNIRRLTNGIDRRAEYFSFHHPYLAFFVMFVGLPLIILIAVSVSTVVITMPIAWLKGWI